MGLTDKEAKVDKAVALVRTKTHSSNILEEEKQSEVERDILDGAAERRASLCRKTDDRM